MAPTVEDFVFRRALRLSEKNILAGARQAALVTNEAMRAGLRDDMSHLDALERGALTPALHAALDEEISQVRAGGAAKIQAALGELESESERLAGADAELTHTRLLIGATRDWFHRGIQHGTQRYTLAIGSHLTVCGRSEANLWSAETQGELLEREGCSVLLRVAMGGADYLFEAAVDGEELVAEEAPDLQFTLSDVDGRTNGDVFWSTAQEVFVW